MILFGTIYAVRLVKFLGGIMKKVIISFLKWIAKVILSALINELKKKIIEILKRRKFERSFC